MKKIATRGAQYPLSAEFAFSVTDTMVDVTGANNDFSRAGTRAFDIINLPVGATVIQAEVVNDLAVTGATSYLVSVGDSINPTRYGADIDLASLARFSLVPTGYVSNGENLRMTLTSAGTATAGHLAVRILYSVANRVNETQTH